jgi:hypothetical protein
MKRSQERPIPGFPGLLLEDLDSSDLEKVRQVLNGDGQERVNIYRNIGNMYICCIV